MENNTNTRKLVCCLNCLNAILHRYGNNPILSGCKAKPQPGNAKFPYAVEVARPLRHCNDHKLSPVHLTIEQRTR